jgi:hypothetical protein
MRRRRVLSVTIVLLGASMLAGCASSPKPGASTAPTPSLTTQASTTDDATSDAKTLLVTAVLPSDSASVGSPPAPILNNPAQRAACDPLIDLTRFVVIPHTTLDEVETFLLAHPTPTLDVQGQARMTKDGEVQTADVVQSKDVSLTSGESLVFTFARVSGGGVGIRVDAQVIPPNALCSHSGGGASG